MAPPCAAPSVAHASRKGRPGSLRAPRARSQQCGVRPPRPPCNESASAAYCAAQSIKSAVEPLPSHNESPEGHVPEPERGFEDRAAGESTLEMEAPAGGDTQPPRPPPPTESPPPPPADLPMDEDRFCNGLRDVLMDMVLNGMQTRQRTRFHAVRAPTVSLPDYMSRVRKYFGCSSACYVLALAYISRLIKSHPHVTVSTLSCHRLVIISLTLAAKFHDDCFYSNAFYARVGGLRLDEFNGLEAHFLKMLGWGLLVEAEEYDYYRGLLCEAAAQSA